VTDQKVLTITLRKNVFKTSDIKGLILIIQSVLKPEFDKVLTIGAKHLLGEWI
jgi:hypothetical protein